jgi:hypothetical protein
VRQVDDNRFADAERNRSDPRSLAVIVIGCVRGLAISASAAAAAITIVTTAARSEVPVAM